MRVIIVTGMPGSGKSEAARLLNEEYGIPIVVMGDVVRDVIRERGLEPTPELTRETMLRLREEDGPGAIAMRCLDKLRDCGSDVVVIEGCRSLAEVEVFEREARTITIVCIHSSPTTRFTRLKLRGRSDAPLDYQSFRRRDLTELSVGIGGVIALADFMIVNEGTLEEFCARVRQIAERILGNEGCC